MGIGNLSQKCMSVDWCQEIKIKTVLKLVYNFIGDWFWVIFQKVCCFKIFEYIIFQLQADFGMYFIKKLNPN